jgi:serine/threonine protein phosphatase PrpC
VTSFINRLFHKKSIQEFTTQDITDDVSATTENSPVSSSEQPVVNEITGNNKNSIFELQQFQIGIAQSAGKQRDSNEDALFSLTSSLISNGNNLHFGLYMVADGMGGHENGEIASRIAVEKLSYYIISNFYQPLLSPTDGNLEFSVQEIMNNGLNKAHEVIKRETQGGGSTLTAALILGQQLTVAHVGDSRAYLLNSDGKLQLLTKDHSVVKRLEEIGQISPEQASNHPQRNILYRALGQGDPLEADIATYHLQPGCQLVICSDGLWGVVTEKDLVNRLISGNSPQLICQSLVDLANMNGGPDNISIILICIPK